MKRSNTLSTALLAALTVPLTAYAQAEDVVTNVVTVTEVVNAPMETVWVSLGKGQSQPVAQPQNGAGAQAKDKIELAKPVAASPSSSSVAPPPPPPPASSSSPAPAPPPSPAAQQAAPTSSAIATTQPTLVPAAGEICLQFTGNDNFYWSSDGNWKGQSGKGLQSLSRCWPAVENTAIFFCDEECQNVGTNGGDAGPPKYTKLECTFGGDWPNCDMSVVDGFSLPVQCNLPGSNPDYIGGLKDLNELTPCPQTQVQGSCANKNAYNSRASVDQYFNNAEWGAGGNYCVWNMCGNWSDPVIVNNPKVIECEVGYKGGKGGSQGSTSKRSAYPEPILLADADFADQVQAQSPKLAVRDPAAAAAEGHSHAKPHAHAAAHLRGRRGVHA